MNRTTYMLLGIIVILLGIGAYLVLFYQPNGDGPDPANDAAKIQKDQESVLSLVDMFGTKMKNVPLTGAGAAAAIGTQYAGIATPEAIASWKATPSTAPGRRTSSPWPDHIEIDQITRPSATEFKVLGRVIEVTSVEQVSGGSAAEYRVTITAEKRGETWLVSKFERGARLE